MTITSVSARRKHYVMKGLATGSSTDRSSRAGLKKQIQTIFGATGFVCNFLPDPVYYYPSCHTDFWCPKLVVEKLYLCMNPSVAEDTLWNCNLNELLGDILLIICEKLFQ